MANGTSQDRPGFAWWLYPGFRLEILIYLELSWIFKDLQLGLAWDWLQQVWGNDLEYINTIRLGVVYLVGVAKIAIYTVYLLLDN